MNRQPGDSYNFHLVADAIETVPYVTYRVSYHRFFPFVEIAYIYGNLAHTHVRLICTFALDFHFETDSPGMIEIRHTSTVTDVPLNRSQTGLSKFLFRETTVRCRV